MSDFLELGLEAADHLIDHHFHKIPNEVFNPRKAIQKMYNRPQEDSEINQPERSPPPLRSRSVDGTTSKSEKPIVQTKEIVEEDLVEKESDAGYEGDEEQPVPERSRSSRRKSRVDPYYYEAEKRTQNPRDYDPECLNEDPTSPRKPYWAAPQPSLHPIVTIPSGPSSSSLYVSHPADSTTSPPLRSPISPYKQDYVLRKAPIQSPISATTPTPTYNGIYSPRQLRSPPANSPVIRGAPNLRYDKRTPNPPPNVDPYYPAQYRASPSPASPPPPPSTTYAASAYVPYPYPTPEAAAAAFGAERPWEYEYDPNAPPRRSELSQSQSRSRSRSQSHERHRHRHRHQHRHHHSHSHHHHSHSNRRERRPGVSRRASSTGDAPDRYRDRDRDRELEIDRTTRRTSITSITTSTRPRSRSALRSSRALERPNIQRRASSTGDIDRDRNRKRDRGHNRGSDGEQNGNRSANSKRGFGLPAKLTNSDVGISVSSAAALAGGFLGEEIGLMLRKSKEGKKDGGKKGESKGEEGGVNPLVLSVLGALVGGLGANLLAGKVERRANGERASVKGWMEDIKGEEISAAKGWKEDGLEKEEKEKEKNRGARTDRSKSRGRGRNGSN